MSELEAEIRKATAGGNLNGMTLWPCPQGWQGNARWKTSLGWTVAIDADPVQALLKALRSDVRYDPSPKRAAPAPEPEPVLRGGLFD